MWYNRAMHPTLAILAAKRQSVRNKLRPLPFELAVSLPLLAVMVAVFLLGGYRFFFILFRFLRDSPPFGTMLTERLLAMVFLAFLSMLVFSNIVTSLSTLYLAGELEFLLSRPIPYAVTFFAKFWESVLYSSTAFVVMGLPIFVAYGRVHEAPLYFYPLVFLFYLPFLIAPAAAGTVLTMLLSSSPSSWRRSPSWRTWWGKAPSRR
jgi:ABC-2 type transport system permease protein